VEYFSKLIKIHTSKYWCLEVMPARHKRWDTGGGVVGTTVKVIADYLSVWH